MSQWRKSCCVVFSVWCNRKLLTFNYFFFQFPIDLPTLLRKWNGPWNKVSIWSGLTWHLSTCYLLYHSYNLNAVSLLWAHWFRGKSTWLLQLFCGFNFSGIFYELHVQPIYFSFIYVPTKLLGIKGQSRESCKLSFQDGNNLVHLLHKTSVQYNSSYQISNPPHLYTEITHPEKANSVWCGFWKDENCVDSRCLTLVPCAC